MPPFDEIPKMPPEEFEKKDEEEIVSKYSLKDFIFSVLNKLFESFTSVKVWMWAWPFAFSCYLFIDIAPKCSTSELKNLFDSWCTFNLALTGTVVVIREQFKVEKIKRIDMIEDVNKVTD